MESNASDEDDVISRDVEVQNSRQLRSITAFDNSIFSMGDDRIRRFIADHSFGQAPDYRDIRVPQHNNISLLDNSTATILLIPTSYTVVTAFPFTVFMTHLDRLKSL